MVDERKSRAIILYVSKGRRPYPRRDPDAVVREFPRDGSDLLAYAEAVMDEMNSLPTDWSSETYQQAVERVEHEMARRHPELSADAIEAIGWRFSYDWK